MIIICNFVITQSVINLFAVCDEWETRKNKQLYVIYVMFYLLVKGMNNIYVIIKLFFDSKLFLSLRKVLLYGLVSADTTF